MAKFKQTLKSKTYSKAMIHGALLLRLLVISVVINCILLGITYYNYRGL